MNRFDNIYYVSDERLEKYREMFPELFRELKEAAEIIRADEKKLSKLGLLIDALYDSSAGEVIIEPSKDDIAENFSPIFALLAYIENCEEEIKRRGFDKDTRTDLLSRFEDILKGHKAKHGFYACSRMLYFWAKHYLVPDIFTIGSLRFEIRTYDNEDIYRRYNGSFFSVKNSYKSEGFVFGTPVLRGGAEGEPLKRYGEFGEPVLMSGDKVISVHIPSGADISEKTCLENYEKALKFFEKYYPECKIKAFMCHSWLMDPELATFLPETSNILSFQKFYNVVPTKSAGEEVMTFVFGKRPDDLNDLPENSTLTRNLKKRYLEGKPIYAYVGVHLLKEHPTKIPELMTTLSGEKITCVKDWENFRRKECMDLLSTYIYGKPPVGKPDDLSFETEVINGNLDGLILKNVTISTHGYSFNVKIYHKNTDKPLPTFLYYMHMKEQNTLFDENIPSTQNIPIKDICEKGYAVVILQYTSVYCDDLNNTKYETSLFKPFSPQRAERGDDEWGAIALWAWTSSRIMDYLETDDTFDKNNVAVVGHSRGGKTALWTGATDPRFSFVVSNSSGCMGAAILRGKKGEHIDFITTHTDWLCKNLDKYSDNEDMFPVDQHMLLACIAPRLLYVESNSLDEWSDPEAERNGARLASEAYELYGLSGVVLPDEGNIEIGKSYHDGNIGYHVSEGEHKIRAYDWDKFIEFWEKKRGVK